MCSLKSSSIIDLVTPGSSVTSKQVREAIKRVESLGFKARFCGSIIKSSDLSRSASPHIISLNSSVINKKFQNLKKALIASDSEAIWCVRGGYGSQKLMPHLLKMRKPLKPKIFIGYSDVTVIHTFLNEKWKWPSLHFPVLAHMSNSSLATLQRFKSLLKGNQKQQSFLNLKLLNTDFINKKFRPKNKICISSYLTGGNLSLIHSSIGTPWAGSFQNKILFLEDIGEAPYRLDRALWQMLNAGVFKGIKALVLGDFIYSVSKRSKYEMKKVFQSFADHVSFPVVEGVPCGHGLKKEALPFMTSCQLLIPLSGKVQLRIASPFVKK